MRARLLAAGLSALLVTASGCREDPLEQAEVLLGIGEYDRVLQLADAEISRDADSTRAHLVRGKALLHLDSLTEAEDAFDDALAVGGWGTAKRVSATYLDVFTCRYSPGHESVIEMLAAVKDEETRETACRLVFARLSQERIRDSSLYSSAQSHFSKMIGSSQTEEEMIRAAVRLSKLASEGDAALILACSMLLHLADASSEQIDKVNKTIDRKGLGFYRRAVVTMGILNRLGDALDNHSIHHSYYPRASSFLELRRSVGDSVKDTPITDAWGNRLYIESLPTSYILISGGADGKITAGHRLDKNRHRIARVGAASDDSFDIVYSNGAFRQWPETIDLQKDYFARH
jgi:hypothetical protein